MKNIMRIMTSIAFVAIFSGCRMSHEEIGETVQSSMQIKFNSDQNLKDHNLIVDSVQVFKKDGKNYKGLASVVYEMKSFDVPVEIVVDGKNVIWEIAPGSLMFIAQQQLRKLYE